jgi:hypothetical protein
VFVRDVEVASAWTRPVYFISRFFDQSNVVPGSATLFFINDKGVFLTCKHVLGLIQACDPLNSKYKQFKLERAQLPANKNRSKALRTLTMRYGYDSGVVVESHFALVNCVDSFTQNGWFVPHRWILQLANLRDIRHFSI